MPTLPSIRSCFAQELTATTHNSRCRYQLALGADTLYIAVVGTAVNRFSHG